jgi:hypothetical protein
MNAMNTGVSAMQVAATDDFDVVSPNYREITGRPARTMRHFLEGVCATAA